MLVRGILNPHLLSLLARVRHTNTLVIADRGFPFWVGLETVDISLVDGVPTVLQVLDAVRANFVVGQGFMAEEFPRAQFPGNPRPLSRVRSPVWRWPTNPTRRASNPRVPRAIGLIRTGDTIPLRERHLEIRLIFHIHRP